MKLREVRDRGGSRKGILGKRERKLDGEAGEGGMMMLWCDYVVKRRENE